MTEQHKSILIEKYLAGNCTEEEKLLIERWYESFEDFDFPIANYELTSSTTKSWDHVLQHIHKNQKNIAAKRFSISPWFWRAAAVIVILIGVSYLYLNIDTKTTSIVNKDLAKSNIEIGPNSQRPSLTLYNGTKLELDDNKNATLIDKEGIKITKQADDAVAYNSSKRVDLSNQYNILSVPRGAMYKMILPDGTKVWLNAASTLRFPVSFSKNERRVMLTGEAYFEVAHNAKSPFHVNTENGMDIKVLGTHFNVNAYPENNSIRTTLLEGSVNVNNKIVLKPNQQSELGKDGNLKVNNNLDLEEIMSWKNGRFVFKSMDITEVMNQIARWYDVEIEYNGGKTADKFSGNISRSNSLTDVLKMLQISKVNFKVEDKKIIVMP